MRLLVVIPHFRTGGAQRLLADLLPFLAREDDMEVTLALYEHPGDSRVFAAVRMNPLIRIVVLGLPASRTQAINPVVRIKAVGRLRKLIKEADVCHVHLFPALYDAALASHGLPARMIFTDHNTDNRRRHIRMLLPLERFIHSHYNTITCVSPASARALTEWLGPNFSPGRIEVIPNGINPGNYNFGEPSRFLDALSGEASEDGDGVATATSAILEDFSSAGDADRQRRMDRAGISDESEVFGRKGHAIAMVSRFAPAKDHQTLIRAFNLLKKDPRYARKLPSDIFLFLAGSGNGMEECKRLAENLGVEADVVFAGERFDTPRIIAAASAGVQISLWEGFGLTACEILAGETPLVVSDLPGMANVVRGAALLVAPGRPEALADALAGLLAPQTPDEVNATMLRQAEGIRIVRNYDIRSIISRWLELYRRFPGKKRCHC